jgi:uncharacterized protein involved in type VI secretion and phage assembly
VSEDLLARVARDIDESYYGKYRGYVTDNDDPDKRGRVRVLVPSILGDAETGWAEPVLPFGGIKDAGLFLVPPPKAIVWIEFEEGDIDRPLWTGARWIPGTTSGDAAVGPRERFVLQTPAGHRVELDDSDDDNAKPRLIVRHAKGAAITCDEKGGIVIEDTAGDTVTLDAENKQLLLEDANGNSVALTDAGVKIEDANGNSLELSSSGVTVKDANGNSLELASAGLTVKGASMVNVKGPMVNLG